MQVPIENAVFWQRAGPELLIVNKSTSAVRTQESAIVMEGDTRTSAVPRLAALRTVRHARSAIGAAFNIQPNLTWLLPYHHGPLLGDFLQWFFSRGDQSYSWQNKKEGEGKPGPHGSPH